MGSSKKSHVSLTTPGICDGCRGCNDHDTHIGFPCLSVQTTFRGIGHQAAFMTVPFLGALHLPCQFDISHGRDGSPVVCFGMVVIIIVIIIR